MVSASIKVEDYGSGYWFRIGRTLKMSKSLLLAELARALI